MPKISKCDLCGTEFDSEIQSHRRGQDCVAPLAERVDGFSALVNKLQHAYDNALALHDDVEIRAFESISKEMEALRNRVKTMEEVIKTMKDMLVKKGK